MKSGDICIFWSEIINQEIPIRLLRLEDNIWDCECLESSSIYRKGEIIAKYEDKLKLSDIQSNVVFVDF